jgi:hypothetical protein
MREALAALAAIWLSTLMCLTALVVVVLLFLTAKGLRWVHRFIRRQLGRVASITAAIERHSREGVERYLVRPAGKVYAVPVALRRAVRTLIRGRSAGLPVRGDRP